MVTCGYTAIQRAPFKTNMKCSNRDGKKCDVTLLWNLKYFYWTISFIYSHRL